MTVLTMIEIAMNQIAQTIKNRSVVPDARNRRKQSTGGRSTFWRVIAILTQIVMSRRRLLKSRQVDAPVKVAVQMAPKRQMKIVCPLVIALKVEVRRCRHLTVLLIMMRRMRGLQR